MGSHRAPRIGLEAAPHATGYPSVQEGIQGANVRMDPWALLVVRSSTHITMPNVVLNETPLAPKARRLTEPAVREHQAAHCLTQLRPSTMNTVFGMPNTLMPSFACSKRGEEDLALPAPWLTLESTNGSATCSCSCADLGFHLHDILLASGVSVPIARGLARPLRAVASANPMRREGSRLPRHAAHIRKH
jgi:hypothetical protein